MILTAPRTRLKSRGGHALSVAAPKVWNSLPIDIRTASTVHAFKSKLKTCFDLAFSH